MGAGLINVIFEKIQCWLIQKKRTKQFLISFLMINRAQRQRMAKEDPYVFYQQQTSVHHHSNMKAGLAK